MDDFPDIDEFRLNMLEWLMEYAEDVCDLTRTNADTARWDEDDESSDAWTYLDDFKTNPAWLAPCGKDPALSSAEWWSNPIETSAHGDENTEIPYAWYFSDARDSLRRRVLLLDAIANRARTEIARLRRDGQLDEYSRAVGSAQDRSDKTYAGACERPSGSRARRGLRASRRRRRQRLVAIAHGHRI